MPDISYPIAERVLANGLHVVVSEDHTVPIVALNIWVKVGSRDEVQGRTGLAHLFEHLMFQGSANVASGEHFSALMAAGGRLNATTWFDRTNYFETVPKGALDLALWLEADRHGRLLDAVTQDNLDNQRDVVKEEKRQRYDNVPYGTALHEVYATIFPEGHPYQHPTIGSMADLDAATLTDVRDFFSRHYGPNNSVITLVGDITPEDGFAAVERYFGGLPASAVPRDDAIMTPLDPLPEPRRREIHAPVPHERLYIAFRLPADGTADFHAAGLALDILGGLGSSRLVERLVRTEQLTTSASAHPMGLAGGVSLGLVSAEMAEGVDPDLVEAIICEELNALIATGPTPDEMEAALADTERSWLSAMAGLDERADAISRDAALFGNPSRINSFIEEVRAITPDHVQRIAREWLQPHSRAVVAYRPELQTAPDPDSSRAQDTSSPAHAEGALA